MDIAYDSRKAGEIHINLFLKYDKPLSFFIAEQLEIIAFERLNSPYSGIQISRIASITALYEVIRTERVWRLVHKATVNEAFSEELVVLFQGIICRKNLPPYTERLWYVKPLIMKVAD
jgi:hypothetical protein